MNSVRPEPADFIVNYSPIRTAELTMWEVDERSSVRTVIKRVRDWIYDANGAEVKRARRIIIEKWGNITSETIEKFLEEKFAYDHLRRFEYAFLSRCLSRKEVRKHVVVDIGGVQFLNNSADVILFSRNKDYFIRLVLSHIP